MSFPATTYQQRRQILRSQVPGGALLLLGAPEVARNYAANTYPFRQDSTFLYYTGLQQPDLALWVFPDGRECLIADPGSLESVVWTGPVPSPADLAALAGIASTRTWAQLADLVQDADHGRVVVHHLLPVQASKQLALAALCNVPVAQIAARCSTVLRDAVIQHRLVKAAEEVAEIESALAVTDRMHRAVMAGCRPGATEQTLVAGLEQIALAAGCQQSYHPILTVRGEILHNHGYHHTLQPGQLLLNDSGAESPQGYASDITRTLPVSGHFTDQQRLIYTLVLDAQLLAIEQIHPGVPYQAVHEAVCLHFATGLCDIGLMQGDPAEAVAAGAHAAFFVHGLGHALGLDVHDMEDLGEDAVGYGLSYQRSSHFGTQFLRFAREVQPGYVLTVEPGLYFIDALFDQWAAEGRHRDFLRYDQLAQWRGFGGIRIEDDVLVTDTGARVLGPGIPKGIAEVEAAMA